MRQMIYLRVRAMPVAFGRKRPFLPFVMSLGLGAALLLPACQNGTNPAQVNRALQSVNDIDNSNMADVMLTVGKPEEAVAYFQQALATDPTNLTAQRGLGKSLMKAGRAPEAAAVWTSITARPDATNEDRVNFAEALIRGNDWARAAQVLAQFHPHMKPLNATATGDGGRQPQRLEKGR